MPAGSEARGRDRGRLHSRQVAIRCSYSAEIMARGPSPRKSRSGGDGASARASSATLVAAGSPQGCEVWLSKSGPRRCVGGQGGGQVRLGPAPVGGVGGGLDEGHLDPERCDLGGKRLAHPLDGPLGGGVHPEPGGNDEAGLPRAQGTGSLDDAATPPRPPLLCRAHRSGAAPPAWVARAAEKLVSNWADRLGFGGLLDHPGAAVAGVVHEDVEAPEALRAVSTASRQACRSVMSSGGPKTGVPVAIGELLERPGGPGGGDHPVATLEDVLGPLATEAP